MDQLWDNIISIAENKIGGTMLYDMTSHCQEYIASISNNKVIPTKALPAPAPAPEQDNVQTEIPKPIYEYDEEGVYTSHRVRMYKKRKEKKRKEKKRKEKKKVSINIAFRFATQITAIGRNNESSSCGRHSKYPFEQQIQGKDQQMHTSTNFNFSQTCTLTEFFFPAKDRMGLAWNCVE